MASTHAALSDGEYRQLWSSLQQHEHHQCTRQCEFKQVFGNMWLCASSGQAHVCDQNCCQRIFYDNHHDICRLSRRIFPRAQAPMTDIARKRSGEEVDVQLTKRSHSTDWEHQQDFLLHQQAMHHAQQQQAHACTPAWAAPAQQQGWAAC